jgi:hypothetical protein
MAVVQDPPLHLTYGSYWTLSDEKLCGCPLTNLAVSKGWVTEDRLRKYFDNLHPRASSYERNDYMDNPCSFIAKQYGISSEQLKEFYTVFDRATVMDDLPERAIDIAKRIFTEENEE